MTCQFSPCRYPLDILNGIIKKYFSYHFNCQLYCHVKSFKKPPLKCSHMRFVILILNSRECGGEGEERGESDERLEGFRIFPKLICTCEHLKWFFFFFFLIIWVGFLSQKYQLNLKNLKPRTFSALWNW